MEAVATSAEEGGADSEGGSVGRGTRATNVEGRDTGPWTVRDEVRLVNTVLRHVSVCNECQL